MTQTISAPASEPLQTPFSDAALKRFLARPVVAVLSWLTKRGEVVSSPVWYEYRDGKFYLHAVDESLKVRSMRRNPAVALLMQDAAPPYRYVSVRATAAIIEDTGAGHDLDERLARRYLGRTGGNYYMKNVYPNFPGKSVLVELTPTRISTVDGTADINPAILVAMKAIRAVGM